MPPTVPPSHRPERLWLWRNMGGFRGVALICFGNLRGDGRASRFLVPLFGQLIYDWKRGEFFDGNTDHHVLCAARAHFEHFAVVREAIAFPAANLGKLAGRCTGDHNRRFLLETAARNLVRRFTLAPNSLSCTLLTGFLLVVAYS